jgi:hypothetical protein
LFPACRNDCEPTVKGGTPEEREELEESARIFYDLLVPELEICVPTVRKVDSLAKDAGGRYNSVTRRVRVSTTSDDTLYHELCHAVESQNPLPLEGPTWELSPEQDRIQDYPMFPRQEAFAVACEQGPTYAFLLGEDCPYDPEGIAALYEARDLFTGPDPRKILEEEGAFTPTTVVPTEGASFELKLTPGGVQLLTDEGVLHVDPWTAETIPEEEATELEMSHLAYSEVDTLALSLLQAPNGAVTERRVFVRSEQFLGLGCVWPEERVFAFDGWLWSASLQQGSITLGFWLVP